MHLLNILNYIIAIFLEKAQNTAYTKTLQMDIKRQFRGTLH